MFRYFDIFCRLEKALHFGGQHPSPTLREQVGRRINDIPISNAPEKAKLHITGTLTGD